MGIGEGGAGGTDDGGKGSEKDEADGRVHMLLLKSKEGKTSGRRCRGSRWAERINQQFILTNSWRRGGSLRGRSSAMATALEGDDDRETNRQRQM